MASPGYRVLSGSVALSAATARTAAMVIAGTTQDPTLTLVKVSFDGVTAAASPVLVEYVFSTQATAGTSSAFTPLQVRTWPARASGVTAAIAYTAEPTVLTVVDAFWLDPYKGTYAEAYPLGREPQGVVTASTSGKGIGVRLTAPAAVNARVLLEFED
jgi:hypothetical protein